ncbi:MAG: AIR synthase related protein [Tissierellia bacterium]|nr:AIR synthase related protein [Tissierellia bacterium]
MANGKLPNDELKKLLETITFHREETLIGSKLGMDTAILDFGKDLVVLSTDPITGASKGIGKIAIDVSVNDVATSGAESVACLISILAPSGSTMEELKEILEDAHCRAKKLKIEIVGGHTEITDAVNRFVVQTTVIGRLSRKMQLDPSKIEEGDGVYVTKSIAMEGGLIFCQDYEDAVKKLVPKEEFDEMMAYMEKLSVKTEGELGAPFCHYMHDITEGGLFGAIYEASQGFGKGIIINEEDIPVDPGIKHLSHALGINVYRLISSGSMLMIGKDEEGLRKAMEKAQIPLTKIGTVQGKGAFLKGKDGLIAIDPPTKDHLYQGLRILGEQE